MRIMPVSRSMAVVLISASTLVLAVGCTAARKTSNPVVSGVEEPPKKEYQWKDMSTGRTIFQQAKPTPQD